jgi:hypothetical protein
MTFSLLGGAVGGSSTSDATQSAVANFIPEELPSDPNPSIVSVYPAGSGLATLGTYYPGAAQTSVGSTPAPTTTTDYTSLLILAALAGVAYMLVKGKL